MSTAANDGNHRITNAILGEQMREVCRRLEGIEHKLDRMDEKMDENRERITRLESKSNVWDSINTFIAIIAATLAGFGQGKP